MDVFKKLTLASIGAISMTREKVEEIFDEMVKRGEMTDDEKSAAVKSFVEKSVDGAEKLKEKVEKLVGTCTEKLSAKLNKEISALTAKIDKLSERIGKLEKKAGS